TRCYRDWSSDVCSSDLIHVDGKKNIKAWNETDAEHIASAISFEIAKNGDSYEVRPANSGSDSRARVDLDISVPKGAAVTIRNERSEERRVGKEYRLGWA